MAWNGVLLDGVTADTNGAGQPYPGGEGLLVIESANFGGGAVAIEVQGFAGTWINLPDPDGNATQGANIAYRFSVPAGATIRATLVGATAPSAVTVAIIK